MNHSPAYILAQYFIDEGHGVTPSASGDWPTFVANMPDGDRVNHDALALFDTSAVKDGRIMAGAPLFHFGVQLQVRASDYNTGWEEAEALAAVLADLDDEVITIGSDIYTINNVTQTTGVVALGQEPGTKRREMFTVNFLVTIQED